MNRVCINRSLFLGLGLVVLIAGCSSIATRRGFYQPITAELQSGHAEQATILMEEAREKHFSEKDRLLYFIDAGMLNYYAGRHAESNIKLQLADAAAEELLTKSVSRAALSILLNDNVLEYAGEDYELLYADLINAMNFVAVDDFEAAFVEIRQANLRLDQLERKYADMARDLNAGSRQDTNGVHIDYTPEKVRFYNDAFARYLSMHLYAAEGKWDDARIDHDYLVDAFRSQPDVYRFPMPEVRYRSDSGTILSVVALAGLAPVKTPFNLWIRTDKQLDLVTVFYKDENDRAVDLMNFPVDMGEDILFELAIPEIARRPSMVHHVAVFADDRPLGDLQLIEDVSSVAEETFKAKRSLVLIRSVVRAVIKGVANYKMKKDVKDDGLAGWLKKAAIDVGTTMLENADLRSTQFLPGLVYVGDFVLPPGSYSLRVDYLDASGAVIESRRIDGYQVVDNGLNMVNTYSVQ